VVDASNAVITGIDAPALTELIKPIELNDSRTYLIEV
jgi:hypothetical protein